MGAWLRGLGIVLIVAGGAVWLLFAPRGLSWGSLVNVPIQGSAPVMATFTPPEDLPYHVGVSFDWQHPRPGQPYVAAEAASDATESVFEGHEPQATVSPAVRCTVRDARGPVVLGTYRGVWTGNTVEGIAGTFWGKPVTPTP